MDLSDSSLPGRERAPPPDPAPAGAGARQGAAPGATVDGPRWLLFALFAVALAAHFFFLTRNWHSGFLIGHEFRQAQTAIITDYIDRQDNFSLRYDTPIFGKPWSAPLEWPLYEWSVVLLKRATGWPDFVAARAVSGACFYLMLPAVYLLLGQAGLRRRQRWLGLALILSCPLYIFYSRAFLMESAVLCLSVWFLHLFVQTLRFRRLHWLLLTSLCGCAAGMMKSLTFAAWVAPALAYGLWTLRREWRDGRGFGALLRTTAWGCATMVAPIALTVWWTHFADSIKEQNPATHFITSGALGFSNYGTFSLAARISAETWRGLTNGWASAIMPPWLLVTCALAGLAVAGRHRRAMLVALGLFLVPQLAIPYAYALQDYYFYAASVFLLVAFGYALLGLLERRWPRWLRAGLLLVPFAGLWGAYLGPSGYWNQQKVRSPGGSTLSNVLRDLTPPDSVIIIAGADWNASIPYYASRRALMITNGREYDRDFVDERIDALQGEEVSALVLAGHLRTDGATREFITSLADLAPRPAFSHDFGDVYFSRKLDAIRQKLQQQHDRYPDIALNDEGRSVLEPEPEVHTLTAQQAAEQFPNVAPAPIRFAAKFGLPLRGGPGTFSLGAHPDAKLWVPAPPETRKIVWEFGLDTTGSPHPDGATDGVVFLITAEGTDGRHRRIFRQVLQPIERTDDRGIQHLEIAYTPNPGEVLRFETHRRGSYTYDWAYWNRIELR